MRRVSKTVFTCVILNLVFLGGCASTPGVTVSSITGDPHASLENTSYHATFIQDEIARSEARFRDKIPVTVKFFLAPLLDRRGGSVSALSTEVKEALSKGHDSSLIVTMTCFVCSGSAVQSARVLFRYSEGVSDEAVFSFIPEFERTSLKNGSASGVGVISFSVSLNGLYVDNIPVPIEVIPGEGISPIKSPGKAKSYGSPSKDNYKLAASGLFHSPDLVISVGTAGTGNVTLHLLAPSPRVLEAFKLHGVAPSDIELPIDSGIGEEGLLSQQQGFYCRVSQLLSDPPAVPPEFINSCGTVSGSPMKGQDKGLSREDSNNLLSAINVHGYLLYHSLFNLGDSSSTLARVAAALKDLSDENVENKVRLVVTSYHVYIPWQMFSDVAKPLDTPDPARAFWGFRYLLSVLPSSQTITAPFILSGNPGVANSLFVTYRSKTYWGSVEDEAASLEKGYFSSINDNGDRSLDLVSSLKEFNSAIIARGPTLGLLVVHSHASAAALESAEKIFFHEKDEFLQPYDLDSNAALQENGSLLFQQRPVVILNACETGATGYVQNGDGSFVAVFIRHGASGVIATQAKVPQWSAFNIAANILESIASGKSVAEAVTEAREVQWYGENRASPDKWNRDPSGLLYAYYGPAELRTTPLLPH